MGKLYAMKKYVERFRHNDEETSAALELNNLDTAQETGDEQQKDVKKSAPPKISQGETSSKKSLPKN